MRTALYMRVSTEEQAKEGYSLPAQRRKLMAYCEAHDWPIVAIYSDEGITGSSLAKRPQATQMIEDATKNQFENILILKVDRLARNTKDLLTIIETLKKYKVHLNAVEETIDYDTPTGKMMLTILGSFAELERSTITARTNAGKEQKRLSGYKIGGGFIPYGYILEDEQFKANVDQAKVIKRIFELYLAGNSANAICQLFQKEKIRSPKNSDTWERSTLMRILRNETYIGYIRGNPSKNIEPIVSIELFESVNRLIQARSTSKQRKFAKDDFIFADVIYCGVCGRKLQCKQEAKPRSRRYYVCYYNSSKHIHSGDEGAHSSRMEASTLEGLFLEFFNSFEIDLKSVEIKADENKLKTLDKYLISFENKKSALIKRKNRSLEKYMDGFISDEEYATISAETERLIKAVDEDIQATQNEKDHLLRSPNSQEFVNNIIKTKKTLADYWDMMDNHEKRIFITTILKRIEIVRGKISSIEFN